MQRYLSLSIWIVIAATTSGCASSGIRVVSEPPGAKVTHVDSNLELIAPCDVEGMFDANDEVVISLPGYRSYRGTLEDLPRVSRGTFVCRLQKQNP